MATTVKGRNVRIELGATYGVAIPVTGITQANPPVATATAHGLLEDSAGYFDLVSGMVQLNGQGIVVENVSPNTFQLLGINGINFPAFASGSFYPVLTWVTLGEATSYTIGGGAPTKLDVTTLLDVIMQQENGLLAAQSLVMKVLALTVPSVAMNLVISSAQSGVKVVIRITHPDGAVRLCYGEPSIPGEDVQQGAVGNGQIDFSVKGFILSLAA